ncbi:hypothetical protein OPKNFCMD_0773 [Methylobacterium crusticola]|uniref:Uncharacterized protein n=1 Tax=Methylobacterium crusticola TaxID=1697972 RepID=A0ABQ4QRX1_9HYPH|nr:hypothetical protein [Methylobacterium crusticola]GJD48057.1 hypothetical protein OPKNFCMD_0773 [Methylobacterium crusticola]
MNLRLQPVQVLTGSDDTEGVLVFAAGGLVAILVHLSQEHRDEAGMWFLEVGFGPVDDPRHPKFADLGAACAFITQCLSDGFAARGRFSP